MSVLEPLAMESASIEEHGIIDSMEGEVGGDSSMSKLTGVEMLLGEVGEEPIEAVSPVWPGFTGNFCKCTESGAFKQSQTAQTDLRLNLWVRFR